MGVGLYYISQNFGRGEGQYFWGNFGILLHFYYQIFSENLGWGVCHIGGSTFRRRGGGRPSILGGSPPYPPTPMHTYVVNRAVWLYKLYLTLMYLTRCKHFTIYTVLLHRRNTDKVLCARSLIYKYGPVDFKNYDIIYLITYF